MAKQVHVALSGGLTINETELAILKEIDRRATSDMYGVPISLENMASVMGKCKATVRRSCQMLEELGAIEVYSRYRADGGRLENEYSLTELGREILAVLRD